MKKYFIRITSTILSVIIFALSLPLSSFAADFRLNNESNSVTSDTVDAGNVDERDDSEQPAYIIREAAEKRDASSKSFLMSDGSYAAYVYGTDVHYKKNGNFVEIDNTLVTVNIGGKDYYTNQSNDFELLLPHSLGTNNPITATNDGYSISILTDGPDGKSCTIEQPVQKDVEKIKALQTYMAQVSDNSVSDGEICSENITDISNQSTSMLSSNTLNSDDVASDENPSLEKTANEISSELEECITTVDKIYSSVTYPDVYSNTDIRYSLEGRTLKEFIIVNNRTLQTTYSFTASCPGLSAELSNDRSVQFLDSDGEVKFKMPAPYMYDSAGEFCNNISVRLTKKSEGIYTYALSPDQQWMRDSSRVYPVTVDPTLQTGDIVTVKDTTATYNTGTDSLSNPGENLFMKVGLRYDPVNNVNREVVGLIYTPLPDSVKASTSRIIKAELWLCGHTVYTSGTCPSEMQINAQAITSDWNTADINENEVIYVNRFPSRSSNIEDYAFVVDRENHYFQNKWLSFDISSLARKWHDGVMPNYGVMIRADSLPSLENFVLFYDSTYKSQSAGCPKFVFYYRDTKGIEDYWTYTSMEAGRFGSVAVNNFNGNLVIDQPAFSVSGNKMPVGVSWIYNTFPSADLGKTYGSGWQTNYNMRIAKVSVPYGEINCEYRLTDADGTDHYFYKKDGKYLDEDGLGLELTVQNDATGYYSIKDKSDTVYSFQNSKLTGIKDSNGITNSISYNSDGKIYQIKDGAGRAYSFTYDANCDATVTDPSGRKTVYQFNNENGIRQLVDVYYSDGHTVFYDYADTSASTEFRVSRIRDGNGHCVEIEYTSSSSMRVKSIAYCSCEGESIKNTLNKFTFAYNFNSTTVTDMAGNAVTYQFNDAGHTVGVVDHSAGSGAYYEYGMPGGNRQNANKVLSSSKTTVSTYNMLDNGSFTSGIENTGFYKNGGSSSISWNDSKGNSFKGSLVLTKSAADSSYESSALWQVSGLQTGKYTFSAYVSTNGSMLPGKGVRIIADAFTASGYRGSYVSDSIVHTGDSEWTRLQVTAEVKAGDDHLNLLVNLPGGTYGTVFIDDVQFECGNGAGSYNLLKNGGFKGSLNGWTAENGLYTANLGYGTAQTADIQYSQYFTGRTTSQGRIYQDVSVSGSAGDTYVFGGWSKAASAVGNNSSENKKGVPAYELVAVMYNSAGNEVCRKTIKYNPRVSEWQYVTGALVATGNYSKIRIYCVFDYNTGRVDFAKISLNKESYGQSYTYDENGNAVSVVDREKAESTFSYNNDNLSRMINPSGSRYYYSYNPNTNNMEYALSTNKQMYAFTYDDYGNVTTASVGTSVTYTPADRDHYYYYIINAGTGNALTKDANGKIVNKHWNATDDNQKWRILYYSTYYKVCPYLDNTRAIEFTGSTFNITAGNHNTTQQFRILDGDNNTLRFVNIGVNKLVVSDKDEDTDAKAAYDNAATRLNTEWYLVREKDSVASETHLTSSATYTEDGNYLASLTDNSGVTTKYKYDATNGNLTESTDGRGVNTTYTYDTVGRTTGVSSSDHSVSYAYSEDQLSQINVGGTGQKYKFVYDEFGRQTNVYVGDDYRLTANTYNSFGNLLLSQLYWNDYFVHYDYDSLDRVTEKYYNINKSTAAPTDIAYYTYGKDGNIASVDDRAAGTRTNYTYDLAGRTTDIYQGSTSDGTQTAKLRYRYENGKNRLQSYNVMLPSAGGYTNNFYSYSYGDASKGELPDSVYKIHRGASVILSREYDSLGRASAESYPMAGYTERYTYKAGAGANQTTTLLEKYTTGRQNTKYEYDANGNITAVYEYENGEYVLTERYTYDDLNQLIRADVRDTGKSTLYTYDAGGNITSRDEYAYTTGDVSGEPTSHKTYGYGNASWKDMLTEYNGQRITYDGMGNPLNYRDGMFFAWKNGRRMSSSVVGSIRTTYDYDIDGNRVERNGAGYRRKYNVIDGVTIGEQITFNGATHYMEYMRDENGDVYGFIYDGSTYFLEKNALGDVMYLLDGSGNVLAKYSYDEWGKKIAVTDTNGNAITDGTNIAHLNPFRYRSYYYDEETGFYYLNSRYYDPETCRFVNADGYVSTGKGMNGYNMFAYCGNNPVNRLDFFGNCYYDAKGVWRHDNWENIGGYVKKPEPAGVIEKKDISTGTAFIVEKSTPVFSVSPGSSIVYDNRTTSSNKDNNFEVRNSYLIKDKPVQAEICEIIVDYNKSHEPNKYNWDRSVESMVVEWEWHNDYYSKDRFVSSSKSVNFDMGTWANSNHPLFQKVGYLYERIFN